MLDKLCRLHAVLRPRNGGHALGGLPSCRTVSMASQGCTCSQRYIMVQSK